MRSVRLLSLPQQSSQAAFRCQAAIGLATLMLATARGALAQVSGVVLDDLTLEPIAGAIVSVQATEMRATTNEVGAFSLPSATGSNLRVVGARESYYNASVVVSPPATGVEIRLDSVPVAENRAYEFIPPTTCGACHEDQHSQWTSSPMADAGTNTWVYDTYDGTGTPGGMGGFVYQRDSRFADTNPESECASCHQPEPWIQEPYRGLEDIQTLSDGALHGISCEVCHKVAHIDASKPNFPGIFPGIVTMTLPDGPAYEQVEYGVLGDADYSLPGLMRPSYQPQLLAEVCAACHQDKNDPDEDGDFEEPNGVISEPTYLEWLESPYGDPQSAFYATCVDCHMPSYGATKVCQLPGVPTRDPETIRHHRIEGTTPAFLEIAADLDIRYAIDGASLEVEALVTNSGTGHHVPTGVTIRNMILVIEALRADNGQPLTHTGTQTIHELGGAGAPEDGYLAGLPGKLFAKVNHDSAGASPTFFTDATGIVFDTRIPALATDTTQYTFTLPGDGSAVRLRAKLLYRRSWRALVDAKGWTEDGHGDPLEDLGPDHGHVMAEEEFVFAPAATDDPLAASTSIRVSVEPNPVERVSNVRFDLPMAGPASLDLMDATGRRVANLFDETIGAGAHAVRFEARDDRGHELPNGTYLLRLSTRDGGTVRRLVVLR